MGKDNSVQEQNESELNTTQEKIETKSTSARKKQDMGVIICLLGLLVAVIVILAGIAMMGDDDDNDDEHEFGDNEAYVDLLAIHFSDELVENQQIVRSMAASPEMAPAFVNGSTADLDVANAVLDNYKETFNVIVCYLMNETGTTIASSNRNTNGSFVGNNYAFRPYFQEAIAGNAGHYFAVGVTSGTRGYYSSYPVRNESGTIVGVAVIKKEVDFLEEAFPGSDHYFLVSPEGIIFLTSDPDLLMHSLWELDQTVKDALITSKEFGEGPFDPVLVDEPANGDEVKYEGNTYKVYRQPVHELGWTIVHLSPVEHDD